MKKLTLIIAIALLSGCASTHTTDGLRRQVLALSDSQARFQQSTLFAQRNTVERVQQLEIRVNDLAERVCALERKRGVDSSDLDKKFKKYMSK